MNNKINNSLNKIIIVGGGTAGWMCAALMAKEWQNKVEIHLVESDTIGTVGVGEGTTPTINHFFKRLNITEQEWMPQCSATYKTGIAFNHWSSVPAHESYFHPFYSLLDNYHEHEFKKNCFLKRQGADVQAHPDKFILAAELAKQHKAPISPANFPFKMTYAYHFDASLLAKFLMQKSLAWGVKHHIGTINKVVKNADGAITSVELNDNSSLSGDFFIDCSGFRSLLLGQALNVPYVSFASTLLNDAAVTIRTPMTEHIPCITTSTALKNGWAWQIPLTNRFGNGYVYSSKHTSAEQAEVELRAHLGLAPEEGEANHLKMRVGRFSKGWEKNCLAIGLSQGFIEPLEATALHFVSQSIIDFIDLANDNKQNLTTEANSVLILKAQDQQAYNQKLTIRYNAIKDYIEFHYLTNSRNDSQYWQDARSIQPSEKVIEIIKAWYAGEDIYNNINNTQLFEAISWQAMLAGVGTFPPSKTSIDDIPDNLHVDMNKIKQFIQRSAAYFPDHKSVLAKP